MNASAIKRAALAAAACALLATGAPQAAAQYKVNIEDLKIRSNAGERGATRQLAEMYYVGKDGVEQDFAEAARWYEKLAKQGDRRAQTTLGLMYARGYGVEKNLETARKWWTFAATQGDAGAQYNLGTLYFQGEGVTQNYAQAAEWYRKAANVGHVVSQVNLGMMYFEGMGIEKSMQWAYYWFRVASLQGNEVAERQLKIIAPRLTSEQVRDTEAQANEWMRKYKKIVGQ